MKYLVLLLIAVSLTCVTDLVAGPTKRQKVIDFEDEVVEALNKRPLDSLNQISERDRKRKKPHLYRKRAGFRTETIEMIHEMRYEQ